MQTSSQLPTAPAGGSALARIAHPFLLFSGMSVLLLLLSWLFLLPRLTQVEIGGQKLASNAIAQESERLSAEVIAQESERRSHVLTLHDPLYDLLKERRSARLPVSAIFRGIERQAMSLAEESDTVHLAALSYASGTKTASLRGDVRSVGMRSMTVLAQFVDLLGRLSMTASTEAPEFTRHEDPALGTYSPFSFSLQLR